MPALPWSATYGAYWKPMQKAQTAYWEDYLSHHLRGGYAQGELDEAMDRIARRATRETPAPHVRDLFREVVAARMGAASGADAKEMAFAATKRAIAGKIAAGAYADAWDALCDAHGQHNGLGPLLEAWAEKVHGVALRPVEEMRRLFSQFQKVGAA